MNEIIFIAASYLLYVAAAYAFLRMVWKRGRMLPTQEILAVFGSALLAWVIAHFIKDLIAHPRPDLSLALLEPNDPYSFPSGHAAFMFGLAWSMYWYDHHAGKILFILATITGIARVLSGVHYWYDIVGGFVLAYLVAHAVFFVAKKLFP